MKCPTYSFDLNQIQYTLDELECQIVSLQASPNSFQKIQVAIYHEYILLPQEPMANVIQHGKSL